MQLASAWVRSSAASWPALAAQGDTTALARGALRPSATADAKALRDAAFTCGGCAFRHPSSTRAIDTRLAFTVDMYRACIAVVDASRARLFTFERRSEPAGITEQLVEQHDLVDPGRRRRPSELFSDSRPGSSRTGNLQYAFDDHREAHVAAFDAEFSLAIVAQLRELVRATQPRRLIICASPKMLGELRSATGDLMHEGLEIDEVPRDLVKLTPPQLRAQLASYGLLPAK